MAIRRSLLSLIDSLHAAPSAAELWGEGYKIPWNDPDFSCRMLKVHLTQNHDMASRRAEIIEWQVAWIDAKAKGNGAGRRLLDIGCGPGLYSHRLANFGYNCTGFDFSPASIAHARSIAGDRAPFVEGDIRIAEFGEDYDVAFMIYGEFNAFSPAECRHLLAKTHAALAPGGLFIFEPHRFDAIRGCGKEPKDWHATGADGGPFSDSPYLCLIENAWIEEAAAVRTTFHIVDAESAEVTTWYNTLKAWTDDEYTSLLAEAGFIDITHYDDWPSNGNHLFAISAPRR